MTSRFGARQSELVDRLRGEAAISGVTLSAFPLMEESGADVEVDGGAERATGQAAFNRVDHAFFDVFGARVRTGRTFDATDFGRGQSHAIVVNRTFATEIAGTENALGRRVRYTTPQDAGVSPEPLVRDCRGRGGFPREQPQSHRLPSVAAGTGSPGELHSSCRT